MSQVLRWLSTQTHRQLRATRPHGGLDEATQDAEGAARPELTAEQVGRDIAAGGMLMILGRVVVLPAGLVASAFLARRLGPAEFGIFSVTISVIVWARLAISMFLSRPSIKLIAEATDWEPVAVALIQIQLLLGTAAGLVAFVAAPRLGELVGGPALTPILRVFAVAIPISTMAHAFRNALNGRRAFQRSALFSVVSELSRLVLVLLLVGAGLGLTGAALAILGTSCVELWFGWSSLRLRLWKRVSFAGRRFVHYSLPLSLDTGAKQLHRRMDLWMVQALAGATAAGFYSVALSFSYVANVYSQAISPVVLAGVTDAWARGEREVSRAIIRQALRLTLWLTPFAALGAGAAPALVRLIYGDAYLPAAGLLGWTSLSCIAVVLMSIAAAILAAVGRPGAAFLFNGPLLGLALVGYLVSVPRVGAIGAAATTAVTTWGVAIAMMAGISRWCGVRLRPATIARLVVVAAGAYALARAWQAPGGWLVPQLIGLCGVVVLALRILGELTGEDLRFLRSLLARGRQPDQPWAGPVA